MFSSVGSSTRISSTVTPAACKLASTARSTSPVWSSRASTSRRSPKRCTSTTPTPLLDRVQRALRGAQIAWTHFDTLGVQALAQFGGRAELPDLAQMHQRDAMAALRFVEIRRGDEDREAVGRQMRERVPEFAARNRIDAGRRLVEQQHLRLRDQRAGQRQLLLHAAAELRGQPVDEAVHVEHVEIAEAALA